MRTIIAICVGAALAGCVSTERSGDEDFNRYVEFCRETAVTSVAGEDLNAKIDWMEGASITTQEFNKEYKNSKLWSFNRRQWYNIRYGQFVQK